VNAESNFYFSGGVSSNDGESLSTNELGYSLGLGNYIPVGNGIVLHSDLQLSIVGSSETGKYNSVTYNLAPMFELPENMSVGIISGITYIKSESVEGVKESEFALVYGAKAAYVIQPGVLFEVGYKENTSSIVDASNFYTEVKIGF
jgi:hypothetical protein